MANEICLMDCHTSENEGVLRFSKVALNDVIVFRDDGLGSRRVVHDENHIASASANDFILILPISSKSAVAQNGALSISEPNRFLLLTTAQPFSGWVSSAGSSRHFSQIIAKIPGAKLRERFPDADRVINRTFSAHSAAARVMKSMLDIALKEGRQLSPTSATSFSCMLIEAIANAVTDSPHDQKDIVIKQSPMARVRDMAKKHIEDNLADPTLNVSLVAQRCGVSERYLHAAFAEVSGKVGAFIREQRLLRCRAQLLDSSSIDMTILQIAMQWGFHDAAHFSRIYKTRFGVPPGRDRPYTTKRSR